MGRRKREDEVDTARLILDEAERLIGEGGYDSLRLKDIAEAIGIQMPSIYGHFEGREGVMRGVAKRYIELLADQFQYDGETEPTKAIVEGIRKFVHLWASHPAYARLRLRDLEAPHGRPELDWAASATAEDSFKRGPLRPMHDRLRGILEDGHRRGDFRKMNSMHLFRALLGATLAALTYPNQRVLEGKASKAEVEEIVREIEDLGLRLLRVD